MENSQKPLANVRSGICNLNKFIIPHFCIFWKILKYPEELLLANMNQFIPIFVSYERERQNPFFQTKTH